ncbi:MAG: hypothetical protein ACYCVD_08070 [Desulfitobacteriaceae bacterium]
MAWVVGIWLAGLALWILEGGREWKLPLRWQEQLSAWGEARREASQTLSIAWNIEVEPELERGYWEIRRQLPALETEQGSDLWIELIVCFKGIPGKQACYERRFRDVQLRVEESQEGEGL